MYDARFLDEIADLASSSLISDAADRAGLVDRTTTAQLRHVGNPRTIVGWARTAWIIEIESTETPPYHSVISFVDSLRPGDVVVVAGSTDKAASWGELFSTAATARGARGAVIDGLIRDTVGIARLGFPVMARGVRPSDMAGRVALSNHDSTVTFGGMSVAAGDLVVADSDGVTTIPREHADAIGAAALDKARAESLVKSELISGASLQTVWDRHEVL